MLTKEKLMTFKVTGKHLKILQNLHFSWSKPGYFGQIRTDGDVYESIAKILDIDLNEDTDTCFLDDLFYDLLICMRILTSCLSIQKGYYRRIHKQGFHTWKKIKIKEINKNCIECKKEFSLRLPGQKTCGSKQCQKSLRSKRAYKYYHKNKKRILKKWREDHNPKKYIKTCPTCSTDFEAKRSDTNFCSQKCYFKSCSNSGKFKEYQKEYRNKNKERESLRKKIWRLKKLGRLDEIENLKLDKKLHD
jgi:hypothetical protein